MFTILYSRRSFRHFTSTHEQMANIHKGCMCSSNNTFFCTHHGKHKTEHAMMTFESASVLYYIMHDIHGGRWFFLRSGQMIWQNRAWRRCSLFAKNSFLSFKIKMKKKNLADVSFDPADALWLDLNAADPWQLRGGCIILRQVFLTDGTAAAQWLVNIPFNKKSNRRISGHWIVSSWAWSEMFAVLGLLLRHLMAFIGP